MAPVTLSRPEFCACSTALHDALEPRRGLRLLAGFDCQRRRVLFDVFGQHCAQCVQVDAARAHDQGGIGLIDQRKQKVLEGGVFVVAFGREP